jgi:hypothetical protein
VTDGPPPLPADLPADLRSFVECQRDHVVLAGGKAAWIPVPPVLKKTVGRFLKPSAMITPLPTPGTARLAVKWAVVGLDLVGSVEDGRLVMRPEGGTSGLLDQVYAGVDGWVGSLNDWLAANGYRLAPLEVAPGQIALRKERTSVA